MLLWFAATSVLTVYFVFRDPRFDYRFLVVGALLPDIVDAVAGRMWVLHSLGGAVGLLIVVMAVTVGNRPWRKRLLGLPIGVLLHIVFDGAFSTTEVFWWPASGGFGDHPLPVVAREWWNLALEAAGAALLVWAWRLFGLADPARRRRALRTGELVATR
ncbi:MAG: hypothetical protein WCP59_05100 [Actinomycetota bacterium]